MYIHTYINNMYTYVYIYVKMFRIGFLYGQYLLSYTYSITIILPQQHTLNNRLLYEMLLKYLLNKNLLYEQAND